MRRLPPLNSLRAFEAAARHMSFTKASEELHVTPGAISQQIKLLETYLGIKLFKRQNRMILLTEHAQVCLPYLIDGLDRFSEGIAAIEQLNIDKPLTITVAEAFASRWLMPRLRSFRNKHPDIDVRIDASKELMNLVHDDIDLGIRYGGGNYPGLVTEYLLPQAVYPVCSPSLLEQGPDIKKPADILKHTLIHGNYNYIDATQPDWEMWFKTVGIENADTSHGLRFNASEMFVQAAIEGQGVALIGSVIADEGLKTGRLVRPLEHAIPLDFAYYFVCAKSKENLPRVIAFREWLLEEIKTANVL